MTADKPLRSGQLQFRQQRVQNTERAFGMTCLDPAHPSWRDEPAAAAAPADGPELTLQQYAARFDGVEDHGADS
jgi:hypothetical protein